MTAQRANAAAAAAPSGDASAKRMAVLTAAFVARYAQQVLNLSPTTTGMLMILPTLAQVVVAPLAGKMLDKGGPRRQINKETRS